MLHGENVVISKTYISFKMKLCSKKAYKQEGLEKLRKLRSEFFIFVVLYSSIAQRCLGDAATNRQMSTKDFFHLLQR